MRPSPFNRYQDYEVETNNDAYEYMKRNYEKEESYRRSIREELDRDYFNNFWSNGFIGINLRKGWI